MVYICQLSQRKDLSKSLIDLHEKTWGINLPPTKSTHLIPRIISEFSDYILLALEDENGNEVMAYSCAIPFLGPDNINNLPDSGYDGVVINAFETLDKKLQPNMMSALSITTDPKFRGFNLSSIMAKSLTKMVINAGFKDLILPIRPPEKSKEPLTNMRDYINRVDSLTGEYKDYWMRLHQKLGAKVIKLCENSMTMEHDLETWEEITGIKFFKSGSYIIPNALVPLEVFFEENKAVMIEPNVWMHYKLE